TPYDDMSKEERAEMFNGPKGELVVTQEIRQRDYDNYETTDDHGMQITGKVRDQKNNEYYIVKNSWGDRENNHRPGYIYASQAFVKYKTISILVHKDVLPKDLKKKFSI
ncbi:MAG: C1 family peptidase, partial [Owenweeksia sp.]